MLADEGTCSLPSCSYNDLWKLACLQLPTVSRSVFFISLSFMKVDCSSSCCNMPLRVQLRPFCCPLMSACQVFLHDSHRHVLRVLCRACRPMRNRYKGHNDQQIWCWGLHLDMTHHEPWLCVPLLSCTCHIRSMSLSCEGDGPGFVAGHSRNRQTDKEKDR